MNIEKIFWSLAIVCAFMYGLVMPMLIPTESYSKLREIRLLFGDSFLIIAIAVILVAGTSGGTMYLIMQIGRHQPFFARLVIKIFVFGLLAVAAGHVASLALRWLGLHETPWNVLVLLAVAALLYSCAGIVGIAALRVMPEYSQASNLTNCLNRTEGVTEDEFREDPREGHGGGRRVRGGR